MTREDRLGVALVAAQLAAGAGLAWPGRRKWRPPRLVSGLGLALVAAGLGMSAAAGARLGNTLWPLPAPLEHASLRTDGPYRVVRHPMYAGFVSLGAGVAMLRGRAEPVVAFAALATILGIKAGVEDRMLRERFGADYTTYAERVPALAPSPAGLWRLGRGVG